MVSEPNGLRKGMGCARRASIVLEALPWMMRANSSPPIRKA